jgi:hypothetical protein
MLYIVHMATFLSQYSMLSSSESRIVAEAKRPELLIGNMWEGLQRRLDGRYLSKYLLVALPGLLRGPTLHGIN